MSRKVWFEAVIANNLDKVSQMLAEGFDVNQPIAEMIGEYVSTHSSALTIAVAHEYADMTQLLISSGANVDVENMEGATPLAIATELGSLPLVTLLVEAGANVNSVSMDIPVFFRTVYNKDTEVAEYLLSKGANIKDYDRYEGRNVVTEAALHGNPSLINFYVAKGADINQPDALGAFPLDHANRRSKPEVVTILKSLGAKSRYDDDEPMKFI